MSGWGRRGVLAVVGLLLSGLFLWLTLRKVDVGAALSAAKGASLAILSLGIVSRTVGFGLMTARTKHLVGPVAPYRFGRLFVAHLVGFAGNVMLPFRMGELLCIEHISRHGEAAPSSLLAVVGLERLLDAFFVLLILLLTLPVVVVDLPLGSSVLPVGVVVVAALGFALLASRRPALVTRTVELLVKPLGARVSGFVVPRAHGFADGLSGLSSIWSVAVVLFWSGAYWAIALVGVRIWLWAFDLHLAWYAAPLILVFTAFGTAVPTAPGFVGAYHFSVVVALGLLGVERDVGVSVAVVGHAVAILPYGLVSIPLLISDWLRRPGLGAVSAPTGGPEPPPGPR